MFISPWMGERKNEGGYLALTGARGLPSLSLQETQSRPGPRAGSVGLVLLVNWCFHKIIFASAILQINDLNQAKTKLKIRVPRAPDTGRTDPIRADLPGNNRPPCLPSLPLPGYSASESSDDGKSRTERI